jgi:hypothetical protein
MNCGRVGCLPCCPCDYRIRTAMSISNLGLNSGFDEHEGDPRLDLQRPHSIVLPIAGSSSNQSKTLLGLTCMQTYQLIHDPLALIIHNAAPVPIRIMRPDERHVTITPIAQLGMSVADGRRTSGEVVIVLRWRSGREGVRGRGRGGRREGEEGGEGGQRRKKHGWWCFDNCVFA